MPFDLGDPRQWLDRYDVPLTAAERERLRTVLAAADDLADEVWKRGRCRRVRASGTSLSTFGSDQAGLGG